MGLWVASVLLVTNALFVFLQAVFQAYFLMRQRAFLITLYSTLYLGSVITLILMGLDYVAPLAAMTASGALSAAVAQLLAKRRSIQLLSLPSRPRELGRHVRFAVPAYLEILLATGFPWISVILIKLLGLDVVFVGYFRGAYGIVSFGILIAATLNVVVMPYVSELEAKGNTPALSLFCTRVIKLLLVLGIPASVGFLLLSRSILVLLLPNYLEATTVMQILSFFLLLMPTYTVSSTILLGFGKPELVVWSNVIACLAALSIGLTLGHFWGVNGIAMAYIASLSAALLYSLRAMMRHTEARIETRGLAASVASSIIMAALVTLVLKQMGEGLVPMLVAMGVGIATYLPLAYIAGAIARDDIEMIKMLIHIARSKVNSKRNQR